MCVATGHLTLYQILLKLLSKKDGQKRRCATGRVERQYEVKHLTRALLEGCEILFFQHLNFSDTIGSSFGLIPERALASNLLLFYFIIACIGVVA